MKVVRECSVVLALSALYAACAGTLSLHELISGVIGVALATAFAVLHRAVGHPLLLRAPWPRLIGSILKSVIVDSIRVGMQLARQLGHRSAGPVGALSEQRFEFGSRAPADAGRRALVTLAVSLAPNKYVVAISPGQRRFILHELVHVKASPDERWPL